MELSFTESLLIHMYLFTISIYCPSQLYLLNEENLFMSTKVYNYFNTITNKINEFTYIFLQAYFIIQFFSYSYIIYNYLSTLESGVYSDLFKKKHKYTLYNNGSNYIETTTDSEFDSSTNSSISTESSNESMLTNTDTDTNTDTEPEACLMNRLD